jgi:MraZ protein
MFQGRFEHTLDDKGRVAIPAPFRKRLQEADLQGGLVVTVADQCLAAYTQAEWQLKIEKVSKLNQLDKNVVAFKRVFIGSAQECPIDKGGRILLPADLRRHAGVDKNCVVLGQIDKFEIWSEERWQDNFAQMSDQIGTICSNLADLGISL